MVEAAALLVGRSDFHRFLPTMSVAEIGARLVDLGDVVCRCSNDDFRREVLDYMLDIASALREGGEYTLPVVVAEVRVRGVNGFVQSGIVCIAPSCICEAIRELWRTDRDLANHVRVAVSPLKKVYDLTKPSEEVELRAVVAGVCRGEGNREVVEAFAKFYIVKKAMENPKFKDEIIAWLKDEERLPRGFIDEFVNYLTSLRIGVSERTVYRALQEIHLTSRNELLNIFGVKVEGEDVKVHCIRPEVVSAILGKLGLQPNSDYLRVICALSDKEVGELYSLVNRDEEFRVRVREFLTGGNASVDGLRELMREYLGASEVSEEAKVDEAVVGEVETGGEAGEVGAMPRAEGVVGAPRVGAVGRGEADVEGGGFRGVHRVEVRCFGVNAGATEECRLLNLLAGFINDGDFSVVPEVKRLLDVVVSRRGPNIGGRDGYAAIRGCVDVELRNLGVENGEEVLELITREGSLRELGRALGGSVGDWASLNETILRLARQRVRDARSIEAINALLEIIKALKDLGPEGLGEHSWVIARVMKAVKDGNWYSLITDLATELELNKEELARHLFGGA
jgi:hypothetical protein